MTEELRMIVGILIKTGNWWARLFIGTTAAVMTLWTIIIIPVALSGNHDAVAFISLVFRWILVAGVVMSFLTWLSPVWAGAGILLLPKETLDLLRKTIFLTMFGELGIALYLWFTPVENDPGLLSAVGIMASMRFFLWASGAKGGTADALGKGLVIGIGLATVVFFLGGRQAIPNPLQVVERQPQELAPAPTIATIQQPQIPVSQPTPRQPVQTWTPPEPFDIGPTWTRFVPRHSEWFIDVAPGYSGCFDIRYPEGGDWGDGRSFPVGEVIHCPSRSQTIPAASVFEFRSDRPMKLIVQYRIRQ